MPNDETIYGWARGWGRGVGVLLPRALRESLAIEKDTRVQWVRRGAVWFIQPAPELKLKQLLKNVRRTNLPRGTWDSEDAG